MDPDVPDDIESPTADDAVVDLLSEEKNDDTSSQTKCSSCCRKMWHYGGIPEAKGYALLAMGRGATVMANLVVNAALLELARAAAGCPTGDELEAAKLEDEEYECTGTVYGQNPLSLISNIAVVSGLLSAFFMPLIGVILDCTPYRRFVGISFSVVFSLIQGAQIGIGPQTWFAMAVLQAFAGFCFTIMIMTALAYLPEMCEKVGQDKQGTYTARFTTKQFTVQASFLILLGSLSYAFGINDNSTQTARMSQGLNVVIIGILFGLGWKYMPSRPASRELPEGTSRCFGIFLFGIRQNFRTAKSIQREYKKGLRWFLLASVFAQSSVASLTTVSVVYLSSEVGLNATDIIIFFFVVLVSALPGAKVAPMISKRFNPNISWQLSMIYLFIVMVIGAFTLGDAPHKYLALPWGVFIGFGLGWFYPTENLFFSCILPKGQEAEISGFRVYCSFILSWLPPLVFSVLVENGVDAKWGMTFMGSFILVAASLLKFGAGKWEEILEESGRSGLTTTTEPESKGGVLTASPTGGE